MKIRLFGRLRYYVFSRAIVVAPFKLSYLFTHCLFHHIYDHFQAISNFCPILLVLLSLSMKYIFEYIVECLTLRCRYVTKEFSMHIRLSLIIRLQLLLMRYKRTTLTQDNQEVNLIRSLSNKHQNNLAVWQFIRG